MTIDDVAPPFVKTYLRAGLLTRLLLSLVCVGKAFCLLPKRIDQRLREFDLNPNHFLEILGVAQLLYKFMSRGDILLSIAFDFSPSSVPPEGVDEIAFFR